MLLSAVWSWAVPATAADVDLTIELELEPTPRLHMSLEVPTSPTGTTRFMVAEEWGGASGYHREIRKLRVSTAGASGPRKLAVKNEPAHVWNVEHPPNKRIRIEYDVVSTIREVTSQTDTYYRPIVAADLVHFVGHTALVVPEHLADAKPRTYRVQWKGFAERGWKVACSFNAGQTSFEYEGLANQLVHSVFIAGPSVRLTTRTVEKGKVAFALTGSDWGFKDSELIKLASQIIAAEQRFFGGHHPPYYVVTLIPVGTYSERSATVGGTGLTQSFALFMTPKIKLDGEQGLRVRYLLAHEHFHHYNGAVVQPTEPEELVYWFSEGFTDFYTRHLLYRAGLFTLDDYVANLNEKLSHLHTSAVRDAPNSSIGKSFWVDQAFHRLPYLRGDILALLLDVEIRRHSEGKRSLHTMMRDLVDEAAADPLRTYTTDDLLEKIETYTSPSFGKRYRAWIIDGSFPHIQLDMLEPCLKAKSKPIGEFDLGFDFDASRAARKVKNVRKGSAAWHAGLRNNQKLLGWSVTYGVVDKPVELTIQGENPASYQTIKYLPQTNAVLVPQFTIGDAAACGAVL